MENETPLAQADGLSSPGEVAEHWWTERLTSASTLFLFVWLGVSLLRLPDLGYGSVSEWLRAPVNATAMLLLILSTAWHSKLGMQVFIDDYVHEQGNKLFALMLVNFTLVAGAALAIFSVLKIALGTAA